MTTQDLRKLSNEDLLKDYADALSLWAQFTYKAHCLQDKTETLEIEVKKRMKKDSEDD